MIIDRDSPIPQYFQLQTWLQEQIQQGVFKPGDKIPTEEELGKAVGADAALNKATYPALFGVEETRKKAIAAVDTALRALEQFDTKADYLRELAQYIYYRNR